MEWLQEWYNKQCDGVWEHMYGVKIETLDNPGWKVEIDLSDTQYQELKKLNKNLEVEFEDTNWIICNMDNKKFYGCGDASKLGEILEIFQTWVQEIENLK